MKFMTFVALGFFLCFLAIAEDKDAQKDDDLKAKNKAKVRTKWRVVISKLRNIGTAYSVYFGDRDSYEIVSPKKTGIDSNLMTYVHPETGKVHKFLFVRGGIYEGSARRLLAATDVKILGKYYGLFGDGHTAMVSDADFENYKIAFGVNDQGSEKVVLSEEQILAEIKVLGAGKYKERKAAKAKLLNGGVGVLPILKKNLKQDDFEVAISLKEIIKELMGKAFKGRRPKL